MGTPELVASWPEVRLAQSPLAAGVCNEGSLVIHGNGVLAVSMVKNGKELP